ncbi:Bor/Iss family lipoprotein [Balneola sp. MJW-20]|uniref:Bor/Iss family lipoprotein n=1 Tax=Gracilimonas aurantiaca TaxID=3234185 RepID=UPI003467B10E
MRIIKILPFVLVMFMLSSCFHAKVTTGKQPSSTVIDKPWAHGFIFGLVPPDEVSVASQCPNGAAIVETQISFLNGLVSAITFNLYTPMQITVTCAAGGSMSAIEGAEIVVPEGSTDKEVIEAVDKASKESVKTGNPVMIRFE